MMPDREKVIRALKHCAIQNDVGCQGCPYHESRKQYGHEWCTTEMAQDVLALLKEQEAMIVRCKDCVSFCYNNPYIGTSASNAIRCPCNSINPDWFCADGVKKDA